MIPLHILSTNVKTLKFRKDLQLDSIFTAGGSNIEDFLISLKKKHLLKLLWPNMSTPREIWSRDITWPQEKQGWFVQPQEVVLFAAGVARGGIHFTTHKGSLISCGAGAFSLFEPFCFQAEPHARPWPPLAVTTGSACKSPVTPVSCFNL